MGMAFVHTPIITSGDMAQSTLASIGVNLEQIKDWAIQAVFTGSPVGTLKIQVSNDIVPVGSGPDPAVNVVNWTDYSGSSQSISAAGNFSWLAQNSGYQWVRLFYTKSSGTGSLSATFNGKEN